MAGIAVISALKEKAAEEILADEKLLLAIGSPDPAASGATESLRNTRLFLYDRKPESMERAVTYLTLQGHACRQERFTDTDIWIRPVLQITVYVPFSCMDISLVPGAAANRIDSVSRLLEQRFQGREALGINTDPDKLLLYGTLCLTDTVEGTVSPDYAFRRLSFLTRALNRAD